MRLKKEEVGGEGDGLVVCTSGCALVVPGGDGPTEDISGGVGGTPLLGAEGVSFGIDFPVEEE